MPPPTGWPVLWLHSFLPERASRATRLLSISPVNTSPPAVAVTAAPTGVGDSYFQAILPVSASIAVTHPRHFSTGSCLPKLESNEPFHGFPGEPFIALSGAS